MNTLFNHDDNDDVDDSQGRREYGKDREITLGTTMVLGIFFALAVLCAVFFGFGYSLGSKRTAAIASVAPATPPAIASSTSFSGFKPAPGSPVGSSASVKQPSPASDSGPVASVAKAVPALRPAASAVPVNTAASPKPAASATAAVAPVLGAQQSMVQIAAVSHQEDADLLVSTLKRRGYSVVIHAEPQDTLLHVQVGPFPSRKDADAMRQRLLADGFNAIVK